MSRPMVATREPRRGGSAVCIRSPAWASRERSAAALSLTCIARVSWQSKGLVTVRAARQHTPRHASHLRPEVDQWAKASNPAEFEAARRRNRA